jgi:dipeptidyl aminopeptidase/acylaminoacyl peptidase
VRLVSGAAALCLVALAAPADARPYTVDDLLAAEEVGEMAFSPDGRRLVYERLGPLGAAAPFDQDVYWELRRSRLEVAEVAGAAPARPLLELGEAVGLTAGPFSPDGRRLVVLRCEGLTYEAGVVELETGEVRWLGIAPELGLVGRTLAWRNADELLIAALPPGEAPLRLKTGPKTRETLGRLWAQTAKGEVASVRLAGSGRFLEATPLAAGGGLLLVNVRTGAVKRLAEGEFNDLEPSPDGTKVAAMRRLEHIQAPPQVKIFGAEPERRRNLVVADLLTGRAVEPCPGCSLQSHLIAWSPASHEVLAYGRRAGEAHDEDRYLRLSPAAPPAEVPLGGLSPVIERTSEGYAIPKATWLGEAPLIYARAGDQDREGGPGGARADWYRITAEGPVVLTRGLAPGPRLAGIEPDAVTLAAAGFAWRIAADGTRTRLFPAQEALPVQGLHLSNREKANTTPRIGWFRVAGDGGKAVYRAADGAAAGSDAGPGVVTASAVAEAGAAQAVRRPDGRMVLALGRPDGAGRVVRTLNPEFRTIAFARTRAIPAVGPKGEAVTHWLVLPAKAKAPPPLVVIAYPTAAYAAPPPPYALGTGRFSTNAELLAAAGYAVLYPALPATGRPPAEALADRILAAVDLAAATGEVDAGRLALMGHSFGGFAALTAATQSDRFKAIIASAPFSDPAATYLGMAPHAEVHPEDGLRLNAMYGMFEGGRLGIDVAPWADPATYLANTPIYAADRISAPVLILHGDSDFLRLPQAQSMFSALYRLRKDALLATFFGEGHIIASPANVRARHRLILDWLARTIGPPGAPPA